MQLMDFRKSEFYVRNNKRSEVFIIIKSHHRDEDSHTLTETGASLWVSL